MGHATGAVFLDLDGVLRPEGGPPAVERTLFPWAAGQVKRISEAGMAVVIVTNQPAVARGLVSEAEMTRHLAGLARELEAAGGTVTGVYHCPHHPSADDPRYRMDCECRKPRPGMIVAAARDHDIDLGRSFLVGDRPSDIAAGLSAGCRAVLVQTGAPLDKPIESPADVDYSTLRADHVSADLRAAVDWILEQNW